MRALLSRFKPDLGLFRTFGVDLSTSPGNRCRLTSPFVGKFWGSLSLPSRFKPDLGLFRTFGVDLSTSPGCGCRRPSPCVSPVGIELTLTTCKSSGCTTIPSRSLGGYLLIISGALLDLRDVFKHVPIVPVQTYLALRGAYWNRIHVHHVQNKAA